MAQPGQARDISNLTELVLHPVCRAFQLLLTQGRLCASTGSERAAVVGRDAHQYPYAADALDVLALKDVAVHDLDLPLLGEDVARAIGGLDGSAGR